MDSNEQTRNSATQSFLLKEEMILTLEELNAQTAENENERALSKYYLANNVLNQTPLRNEKINSDVALGRNSASPSPKPLNIESSSDEGTGTGSDKIEDEFNKDDRTKLKKLKQNAQESYKEKMVITSGFILIFCLLVWNGLIVWLIQTLYTYSHQTFGWKIILGLLYMWVTSVSTDCTSYTQRIFVKSNPHCVREEIFMNCPYEVQFSASLGTFLFFLAASTFNVLLASLCLGSRKIRQKCGSICQFLIRNSIILCCWISIWLMIPFIMNYYSSFSKLESEMKETINEMNPPDFISLWWNQTQAYSKCCGIKSYDDWETTNGTYPMSCCNNIQNICEMPPEEDQVWLNGCYDEEYKRLEFFGGIFITFWVLKIVCEFLLFCILCQVFGSYTKPEDRQMRSSIQISGYKLKMYGDMGMQSVPNRHQIVIGVRNKNNEEVSIKSKQTRRLLIISSEKKGKITGCVKIIALHTRTVKNIVVSEYINDKNLFRIDLK